MRGQRQVGDSPEALQDAPDTAGPVTRSVTGPVTGPATGPGRRRIGGVNWSGLSALYRKEVRRFIKVQFQTIWAPAVTTLLYLVIFTVALGSEGRRILGTDFTSFLAPGLIAMAMLQAAFANASFSLLVGKIQGTIIDYLMPPLSDGEVLIALVAASVTRALLVGGALWLIMALAAGVSVAPMHGWAVLWFGLSGSVFVALIGVLTSIWAEKFDHAAAVSNFVIAPLSLLSGTFYTVEALSPLFRAVSHANPFFFVISGFRYGFIGVADSPVVIGALVMLALNTMLAAAVYLVMRSGWKLRG